MPALPARAFAALYFRGLFSNAQFMCVFLVA
jgi:hypothetical protein